MANRQHYKHCGHPCPRFITGSDTHPQCVVCFGEEHAKSALKGADCEDCELLPMRVLRSRLASFVANGHKCGAYEELVEVVTRVS